MASSVFLWPFITGSGASLSVLNLTAAGTCSALLLQTTTATIGAGGGSTATLTTVGGSGPATAGQNGWLTALDSTGATVFIPVWK